MQNGKIFESPKVTIYAQSTADTLTFRLMGIVDEDCQLGTVLRAINRFAAPLKEVIFDLSEIQRINSCGVREWLVMMDQIDKDLPCRFVHVNQLIIEQANIVPRILGHKKSRVESFQVPFQCRDCGVPANVELRPDQVSFRQDGRPLFPETKCKKCGKPLEFDSLEDEYFEFLKAG